MLTILISPPAVLVSRIANGVGTDATILGMFAAFIAAAICSAREKVVYPVSLEAILNVTNVPFIVAVAGAPTTERTGSPYSGESKEGLVSIIVGSNVADAVTPVVNVTRLQASTTCVIPAGLGTVIFTPFN
jgi:hypothetical protein